MSLPGHRLMAGVVLRRPGVKCRDSARLAGFGL
jgi:hypothetical protein